MVSVMENRAARAELLTDSSELRREVELAIRTPVIDVHTHVFPPEFDGLFLHGIDDLLTYHYLIALCREYAALGSCSRYRFHS